MSERDRPFEQLVAEGAFPKYSVVEKFGENSDVDAGPEDIWSQGGLYTFSTTADITKISSSSSSDTVDITMQGLDADWNLVTQTVTLEGQTEVDFSAVEGNVALIRCFRAWNSNGTDLVGTVYIYVDDTVSSGVPQTATKIRATIAVGAGQTEMCIYTIPAGYIGYFYGGYVAMSRSSRASASFTSRIRTYGGVFRVASRVATVGLGASHWQYKYPIPLALPAKTDILLRCDDVEDANTGVSGGFTIVLKDLDPND